MRPSLCILVAALLVTAGPAVPQQSAFEPAPTFRAADLAPAELLAGPHFKVAPQVPIEDYLAKFQIVSDFGTITAHGTEMLRVRVNEVAAIASLAKVSETKAFGEAAEKGAKGTVDFGKTLVNDPGKAVTNVATGIGSLFGRAGNALKQGADYAKDTAADERAGKSKAGSGDGSMSFRDDPLGYNKAKRDWAKQLQIDPYSSNPVLQEKLTAAARATFLGDFSVGLAGGAAVGMAYHAVDLNNATRDMVWDKSPGDLDVANEAKLGTMGISGRPVRDFFRTPAFTPTLATALVLALDALPNVRGRPEVVAAMPRVVSEAQARFVVNALRLLGTYSKAGHAIVALRMSGRIPVGVTPAGGVVVPAAIDYLPWTQAAADFAGRKELAAKEKILLLVGRASPTATQQLAARGWRIEPAPALGSS